MIAASARDCFHCSQVVSTIDMQAAQPRNKVAQTLHNMTLRIITTSPSITQAIKHIHIEIKCKHKFGINLIEIRHLCVQYWVWVEHYVSRVRAGTYLSIRNVLSAQWGRGNLLLHIMYFHFTAKRAVIRCWRSIPCPLGPIKRSIAEAAARSIETIISTTLMHNLPSCVCVRMCVCLCHPAGAHKA